MGLFTLCFYPVIAVFHKGLWQLLRGNQIRLLQKQSQYGITSLVQMAVVIANLAFINNSNESLTKKEVHSILYFAIVLLFTLITFKNKPFNERIVNHYHFALLVYLC